MHACIFCCRSKQRHLFSPFTQPKDLPDCTLPEKHRPTVYDRTTGQIALLFLFVPGKCPSPFQRIKACKKKIKNIYICANCARNDEKKKWISLKKHAAQLLKHDQPEETNGPWLNITILYLSIFLKKNVCRTLQR